MKLFWQLIVSCLLLLGLVSVREVVAQVKTVNIASEYFTVQEVAPQIWALIVKPGAPVPAVCNSAFLTLGDRVLVVDSHFTPRAAREAARIIKEVTGKKVHYLVNTHWHPDHVQGNSIYLAMFSDITSIIAHSSTRREIGEKEVPSLQELRKSLLEEREQLQQQLRSGRDDAGNDFTLETRRAVENNLQQTEALYADIEKLEVTLPNLTFDRSLVLNSGDREVQLLYFGRGHTAGDIVVFLPQEGVLITGDLLTNGIPFMRDAFPLEWSTTLAGAEKLNFKQVIPGHGPIQQGKERLQTLRTLLDDLVMAVRAEVNAGKSIAEVRSTVKERLREKYGKQYANYNVGIEGAISRTYNALTGNK
jgi:glyoxylase-like metal-dependent hydrolase (beta-lactamase superfamily II)